MIQQELRIGLVLSMLFFCGGSAAAEDAKTKSFYKAPALFSTRPDETKSLQTIKRFGPVGMGIDLIQPAFRMKIHNIEEGSPAAETGKLKKGQIIETINGRKLADIDPRIQLGRIITKAEATDGVLKFMVKDKPNAGAQEVIVRVPVLGAYSKTWPLNCPKSNRIVRNFADHLAAQEWGGGLGINGLKMLFMLSTGEEKDLAVVRKWVRKTVARHKKRSVTKYAWYIGYGGIPLAEYYLRTGDKSVLPLIKKLADNARETQYLGGWAGRGGVAWGYNGVGHLNAAGTNVVTFLLLAKECGVDVDKRTLHTALEQFYRFAGRGTNPYGDHLPGGGFIDNGKTGNLAFAMAAAASLTPDGENSVYAKARDVSAVKGFYTTSYMLHGHTGGGIGEIWRSAAMGLMYHRDRNKYRQFMDNRRWFYELSRRYNGSFGILGGGGYDKAAGGRPWGVGMALSYTIPRRTLQISGAPDTPYCHDYQLPESPWGAKPDDLFLSFEPVPGRKQENAPGLEKETLADDSARAILRRFNAKDVSPETVRYYAHHQDYTVRKYAAQRAAGLAQNRLGWRHWKTAPPDWGRRLIVDLLASEDPRLRRAGISGVRTAPGKLLTDEVFSLLAGMINDPDESWWVVQGALETLPHASADRLGTQVDTLLHWLDHEEWWLREAALSAVTPVAADKRCYQKVLPAIGDLILKRRRAGGSAILGVIGKVKQAGPKVQALARKVLGHTYGRMPETERAPGGQDLTRAARKNLDILAHTLAEAPGGFNVLYEIAGNRFPQQSLPHKQYYLNANPDRFGPKLKKAIRPIILNELIPAHVGKHRARMRKLAAAEVQSVYPGGRRDPIDELTALYRRAGINDYNWHMFADLRHAEWWYHTFDPIPAEQVPWDQLITRYRDVTLPKGMENWFALDFDPHKAGWKRGQGAFGQYNGKIPEYTGRCTGPVPGCFCGTKVKTLWDKEVLLLRGTFKIPGMKPGYRYRLRVNDGDHVGRGGGHIIYINGKKLSEKTRSNGRGSGGRPKGAFITKEFLDDFQGGKVTIAVKTFLRFNHKYKVKPTTRIPQGKISLHFEEMKLPPMGDDLVHKSATVVPMLSSQWQAKQNPDNKELQTEDDKFRWDGKFVPNPKALGAWTTIGAVKSIEDFTPEKKMNARRAGIKQITFKNKGLTGSPTLIWSGDTLMDLDRYEALKMKTKKVGGSDYLFIETGGFSTRKPADWHSPWQVMQRK